MREFVTKFNNKEIKVQLVNSGKSTKVGEKLYKLAKLDEEILLQNENGEVFQVEDVVQLPSGEHRIHINGFSIDVRVEDPLDISSTEDETTGEIHAPMAGVVTKVLVQEGDNVSKGDHLLLLSAMKMENEIVAPFNGTVITVKCAPDDQVNALDLLMILEPSKD